MITVHLTLDECVDAWNCAKQREYSSRNRNLRQAYGASPSPSKSLMMHFDGVKGEMVAAKSINHHWVPTVNTFSAPDIGSNIQVRTRSRDDYQLIVRNKDADDEIFILVRGKGVTYTVVGWVYGHEAKQEKYLKNHGGRPAAYFVPDSELRNINALMELVG